MKEQAREAKLAAERKAEEDAQKIAEAVAASGKSVEEILEFLKK